MTNCLPVRNRKLNERSNLNPETGARRWQAVASLERCQEATMINTSRIDENYGRFEADDRSWDVNFWQSRGGAEIFAAVWGMILDHRLLTEKDASEPRLQRTVEHFGKA